VSILIPRDWFNKIGGFDETLTAFEDVDLIMNLLIHGYCGRRIAEPLLIYNLNSGYRRLASEKKQADFKTLLIERYGDYMRGEKMCQCIDPPKGKKALPPTPDNVAEYRSQYGEMVMARLIWEDAPEAPVTFRGPATRVNYQSRAKGDVFYVWEQDILRSEGVFERLENYETTPMQTVAPPEPTLQGLDVHIIPGHAVTVEIPDNEAELTEQIVSTMKPTAKAAKGKPGRKAKVR
jgi:hypothetical protein